MPAGTPATRKRGRTQFTGSMAPGLPLPESCGSSTHRLPGEKLSAAPKSVGALAGTPSPMMGATGKSLQAPFWQVACAIFGLPGSASAGAPPWFALGSPVSMLGPPAPELKPEPAPPDAPEPLLFVPGRRPLPPPPLFPLPHAPAPATRAPANTARPRYFRIVNTPNQQRPEKPNGSRLAAAESRNEPRGLLLVNEKRAFPCAE